MWKLTLFPFQKKSMKICNEKTVRKLNDALERIERGEFLTEEEMRFDDL